MTTANLPPGAMPVGSDGADPFLRPTTPIMGDGQRHRYGGFDSNAFSLFATGSPSQAKRALEAHLAETERRLQEASRVGQVLVNQRKELADRLKELENQQDDQINPALKARLVDLEKEFNDVNRETARIFVGKNRVPSGEAPEREATEFGGVAHPSPSKAHAPSRKQRNQQPSRVNDLQLATDISAELLEQVRILQASLAEKDAALKDIMAEKTHLEADLEATRQRARALDESEQRYKDENWALETQLHELTATHKEATTREERLTQNLSTSTAQKASLERDFEDLKQTHAKLAEDHAAVRKQHDAELTSLKKNATADETQITGLHKKVEELTSQNKDLAQAFAYRLQEQSRQVSGESAMSGEGIPDDVETPEDSPPGSPSKATPRHGALHEETTKSALNHAYRTIQNLKNQLHREKTEKMEYRRLLQDARDDLESKRSGVDSGKKRKANKDQELFKKPSRPDRLGEARDSKEEIMLDEDEDWEDHDPADTPSKSRIAPVSGLASAKDDSIAESSTEAYATATENSDAFETATEREAPTESEAFQTGVESLDGDSDLTETETGSTRQAASKPPGHAHRLSFQSTASTSADELDDNAVKTPVQSQHPKYKIRVGRGGQRRLSARDGAAEASRSFEDSPATVSSNNSTPMGQGQSLFAELGNLSDPETEERTPASSKVLSPVTSPEALRPSPLPSRLRQSTSSEEKTRPVMVDTGIMTEPWEPASKSVLAEATTAIGAAAAGAAGYMIGRGSGDQEDKQAQPIAEPVAEPKAPTNHLSIISVSSQDTEPVTPALADFPEPPLHKTSATPSQESQPIDNVKAVPLTLSRSTMMSQHTDPVDIIPSKPIEVPPQVLSFSATIHQDTVPVEPVARPSTATKITEAAAAGAGVGFFGSLLGRKKTTEPTTIAEDETSQPPRPADTQSTVGTSTDRLPLRQIEGNAPPSPERKPLKDGKPVPKAIMIETSNESTQTALSSEDLDKLMTPKLGSAFETYPGKAASSPTKAAFGSSSPRRSRDSVATQERAARRPGSAGSHRSRERSPAPPLPTEAKQVIAAATAAAVQKPASPATSPAAPAPPTFGNMGPPTMPASAYRNSQQFRPRTPQAPQEVHTSSQSPARPVSGIAAARPGTANRSQLASPTATRRSSVSSFASELDHRFNISNGPYDALYNDGGNTDPRMIQAITQTMIGEYLYKYTRKAGSKEMSSTRHKRFFWVHPYTRTLYWSEQDPASAGKQQLKAKSVQIEAVRIVTDDNPMPPGLHRKSLVITTPGRTIKFTAPTSQRHETWSNALTYLLLKTGAERDTDSAAATDAEEFNPSLSDRRSASQHTRRSRQSVSSYMSRTTVRTASPNRQHPTLRASSAQGQRSSSTAARGSLSNRLSAIAGSISSRHSRQSLTPQEMGIADAHNPNDSAEDLRKVIEQQEREADRLENVRACCDGKHDVGSLSRTSRHSRTFSTKGHTHSHSHGHSHHGTSRPQSTGRGSEAK